MIINPDREPKYSLYYIGAIILKTITKEGSGMNLDKIVKKLKIEIDEELNINFIYYALDWLYLISLIDIKENKVILCK
jgi:hypothetical protein